MLIQKVPVSEVNPAPYNPRIDLQPGHPDYEKLKKSIIEFGYVEPLVWNKRTGTLVGGHQRFKILKEQGLKEVDVSGLICHRKRKRRLTSPLIKFRVTGMKSWALLLNLKRRVKMLQEVKLPSKVLPVVFWYGSL